MSKLERIIQQLTDGTYKVSSQQIAEKLLKKNPKLSDKTEGNEVTKFIGEIRDALNKEQAIDAGCKYAFQFNFKYNGVPYGSYLIGVFHDLGTIVLDRIGDNYEDFDDTGEMQDAFDRDVDFEILELGLS